MYTSQVFCKSIFQPRPNPINVPFEIKNFQTDRIFVKYLRTIRSMSVSDFSTTISEISARMKLLCEGNGVFRILKYKLHTVPCKLKHQSATIIQSWTQQCECVAAQQLRRGQQMFCLYSRLWEERALKELLKLMRQQLVRRSREFVFGAIGISAYDWDTKRIKDNEIGKYITDFDYINLLKEETVICKCCNKRRVVDVALPDIQYCKCSGAKKAASFSHENWTPFLERKDLMVWRRILSSGHYEYKVYGTYNDVTADAFLQVQIDTNYRKKWDTTAINLEVVDSDPTTNSDVVYWEMLWPRLFSNRDYVFNRRYVIKEEEKIILILSRGTEHPSCPVKPEKYRVSDYYSCMVIRPNTEMDKPGIEFTLTYFDNPGVNIPQAVTSWVAMAGMPDFLCKLRQAARDYKFYCSGMEKPKVEPPDTIIPAQTVSTSETSTQSDNDNNNSYWRYLHPQYYLG